MTETMRQNLAILPHPCVFDRYQNIEKQGRVIVETRWNDYDLMQ